jgi:hypothetical protein
MTKIKVKVKSKNTLSLHKYLQEDSSMIEEGISLNTTEHYRKRKKRSDLRKTFGINADQYNTMLEEQGHACAICGEKDICNRGLAVDHCHTTNRVRGLLCTNCNMALGKFQDNTDYLKKAIEYLERDYQVPEVEDSVKRISHDDRPNWKMLVTTPDGMFPSMSYAAKHYDVHETTIRNWCLPGNKHKKEGYSCEKLYVSMNYLKEYIGDKNQNQ